MGQKRGGIHFRKRRLCWKNQRWGLFFMENLSFNGMCLLELRVGFSWGGSVGCLFYILFPGSNGCRQVIEGDFSSPFCFTSKVYEMCFVLKWPLLYQAFHQRRLVKSPTLSNLFSNGPKYIPTEQPKRNSEKHIAVCMQGKVFPWTTFLYVWFCTVQVLLYYYFFDDQ